MTKRFIAVLVAVLCVGLSGCEDSSSQQGGVMDWQESLDPSYLRLLERKCFPAGSNRDPYSVAQVLFMMNTPESRDTFKQLLRHPDYDLDDSIRCAFYGKLSSEKRDEFIREYHLNSRSEHIEISVQADPVENVSGGVKCTGLRRFEMSMGVSPF